MSYRQADDPYRDRSVVCLRSFTVITALTRHKEQTDACRPNQQLRRVAQHDVAELSVCRRRHFYDGSPGAAVHSVYYLRTDNASWSFFRQRIVEICACWCDKASLRLMAERAHRPVAMHLSFPFSGLQRPPRVTASGRTAEDIMHDELSARQRAISLRLAGRTVKHMLRDVLLRDLVIARSESTVCRSPGPSLCRSRSPSACASIKRSLWPRPR